MFPLRVRSYYSLMQATGSPARLCERAKQYGFSGLALTDRDNLYGLWPFLAACRRQELQPVVGVELTEPGAGRTLVCLVRSGAGYADVCNLITKRHTQPAFNLVEEVQQAGGGITVLSRERRVLEKLDGCGIRVAADLGAWPTEDAARLKTWAAGKGIVSVATPDCTIVDRDEGGLYCLLRAIAENKSFSHYSHLRAAVQRNTLVSLEQYLDRFAMWPEVLQASLDLAAECTFSGPEFGQVMPLWKKNTSAAEALRHQAYRGACGRYGDDLAEPVVERLEHELRVIESMGFSAYFLVVRDIVHRKLEGGGRKKRRICGRGSGAASLVAYCLEITNICPIKYNLYFERFLNPGRTDPPDIDIDFAWDERDEVIAEVLRDHRGHSAMVCNHIFFKPRMAVRETAKAYGVPGYEISRLTKRFPWLYSGQGQLYEQLTRLPALRNNDFSPPWPHILALAERLIGIPRYLSVHPGGIVLTPKRISDYVPVEISSKGVPIIQWEKDGTEEAGLVKIDLLGNRSLGVIRDCVSSVKKKGVDLSESEWQPEDDSQTQEMISQGGTMGCFYIESPAMRLLQKKAGSGDFEQLVIQSSIIRPAANEFVREYVRRLHGVAWAPLHEKMGDVLDETFGLMVYQEDVAKTAVALAGFSHARADGFRKVLSKKDKMVKLRDYREEFFQGCRENCVDEESIEKIWQMMMSFDGYSFCKPHSASYARVSFQAAYLKSHFPAEFMAAVISNQGGYYSLFAYVSEAKRLGINIIAPDVNRSERVWTGSEGVILVGLQAVKGVSENLIERICTSRKEKRYTSVADFFSRTRPAEDEARMLIHAGALDRLQTMGNRTTLLWELACFCRLQKYQKNGSLFEVSLPVPPKLSRPNVRDMLRREYAALGFLCRTHPMCLFDRKENGLVASSQFGKYTGKQIRFAGWLLTGKLVSTKTGEPMEFLTFEDEMGLVEATFFPEIYKRYAHILMPGRPYVLVGVVEEDFGAVTLTVKMVYLLKTDRTFT